MMFVEMFQGMEDTAPKRRLYINNYSPMMCEIQVADGEDGRAQPLYPDPKRQDSKESRLLAMILTSISRLPAGEEERISRLKAGFFALEDFGPKHIDESMGAKLQGRIRGAKADVYIVAPEDTKGLTIRINLPDGRTFSIEIEARGVGAGQALLVMILRRLVSKLAPGLKGGAIKVDDLMGVLEDVD